MEQRPVVMSKSLMISATERAQRRIKEWEEFSTAVLTDGRKEERLARLECKACFYPGRIGGAAMTYRPCMSCSSRELYGSTNTDVLCAPCATAGDLCKHCGGDREMRARRKNWPAAYSETPNAMFSRSQRPANL
jgi:hypothetical protein